MATCKECLHYEVCGGYLPSDLDKDVFDYLREGRGDEIPDIDERCGNFKRKSDFIKLPCKVGDCVWYFDEESRSLVKGKVDGYLWFRSCGFALNVVWEKPIMGHFSYRRKEMPINEIGKTVFLSPADFTKRYLDTSDLEKAVEHLERYKKMKESEQIGNGDKEEQNG